MATVHIVLAIIIAMLAALIYAMRILVLMERRMARMDKHIEGLAKKILAEEEDIEDMLED